LEWAKEMNILSEDDELTLEKNLIWIFADRRSGTTWLAKELLSYNTNWMDEPLIGLHLGRYEFSKNRFTRMLEMQADRKDYFFSKEQKDTWQFFLRKLILNRINNQFDDISKKIIIKEPTGSMASDILAQCLPHSKIIILLRDGRDIIDSKIDAESPGGWEIKEKKGFRQEVTRTNRPQYIRKFSILWNGIIEILLKAYENHSSELRLLLKYEDLRVNTFEELKKIYQFLEIKIDDKEIQKIVNKFAFENIPENQKGQGEFKRFASPGKWRENFNDEEKALINNLIGETLKKLGYLDA